VHRRDALLSLASVGVVGATAAHAQTSREQGPGNRPWAFDRPEAHGLDSAKLKAAGDLVGKLGDRQGLVIVRDGVIVYEDYWHGDYHQATPVWRNVSFSAAKSWGGAIVGVAVTKGLLNVNDLVEKYHKPEDSGFRPGTTIRNVLQMASGGTLIIKPSTRRAALKTNNPAPGLGIDYLKVIKPVAEAPPGYGTTLQPGKQYYYDGEPADHLANVVAGAARISSHKFAVAELLTPLGVENFNYQPEGIDSHDDIRMAGSIEMSCRDFARLGQLYLNGGRWNGRQLIAESYIRESVTPSPTNPNYGYLWHLNTNGMRMPGAPRSLYMAAGNYAQLCMVLPQQNMVIATMGFGTTPGQRQAGPDIWKALAPAIPA